MARDGKETPGSRIEPVDGSDSPAPSTRFAPAVLAGPPHARREHAGLDVREDLGGQAVEPQVRRAVAGGPVAVELGLAGLRQQVKPEAEVGLVGEALQRRGAAGDEIWGQASV